MSTTDEILRELTENYRQKTPVDLKLAVQFNPERILIGEQYARSVHGGIAVALYYQPGFRSAWYKIRKG
jgi:hypothetical protein